MICREVPQAALDRWRAIWERRKDGLRPNRKSGAAMLAYVQNRYVLTEIYEQNALAAIRDNVLLNAHLAQKLPRGAQPEPRAFFLENAGAGQRLYRPENRDDPDVWGGEVDRIFVGVDVSSGFYMVEGSSCLWDELCAFQGLDAQDIENFVSVGQYLDCLEGRAAE
ncbi:MAG: hypothetical protein VB092_05185 [Oscillospiraceae bacterium]|nr:hypothetical protein [Oscillospiraceae bacterium]